MQKALPSAHACASSSCDVLAFLLLLKVTTKSQVLSLCAAGAEVLGSEIGLAGYVLDELEEEHGSQAEPDTTGVCICACMCLKESACTRCVLHLRKLNSASHSHINLICVSRLVVLIL